MSQRIVPTVELQQLRAQRAGGVQSAAPGQFDPIPYQDTTFLTPDEQFNVLSLMLENADAMNPAPLTNTPPWGEPIPQEEYVPESILDHNYIHVADLEPTANVDLYHVQNDAPPLDIPEWTWENDGQYYGLGVPPGVPNWSQPIESGHSQIILHNPSSELGWDEWSGRPKLARVARMENYFSGYRAGQSTGHNIVTAKISAMHALRMQQARDLLLAEIQRRGIHNVQIQPVAAVSYTDQVTPVDASSSYHEMEIGPEGVLP